MCMLLIMKAMLAIIPSYQKSELLMQIIYVHRVRIRNTHRDIHIRKGRYIERPSAIERGNRKS